MREDSRTAIVRSLSGVLDEPETLTSIARMVGDSERTNGTVSMLPKMVARYLGASDRTARLAVRRSVEMLVDGLADRVRRPLWAKTVFAMLDRHDPALLDNVSVLVSRGDDPRACDTVDMLLGDRRLMAEIRIADETGLSEISVSRLLELLTPMLMSFLAHKKRREGMDLAAMVELLAAEQARLRIQLLESHRPNAWVSQPILT